MTPVTQARFDALRRSFDKMVAEGYSKALRNTTNTFEGFALRVGELHDQLGGLIDQLDKEIEGAKYTSEGVPAGYSTVFSYLGENYRHWLDTDPDAANSTIKIGKACAATARALRSNIVKVTPPPVMSDRDVESINAYPNDVVRLVVNRFMSGKL